jgi:hypothetical protein
MNNRLFVGGNVSMNNNLLVRGLVLVVWQSLQCGCIPSLANLYFENSVVDFSSLQLEHFLVLAILINFCYTLIYDNNLILPNLSVYKYREK